MFKIVFNRYFVLGGKEIEDEVSGGKILQFMEVY